MRRFLLGVAALALCARPVQAQTTPAAVTFVAVDGIRHAYASFYVTGVVQGEGVARQVQFIRSTSAGALSEHQQSCERFLLLAMEKPGRYLVTLTPMGSSYTLCSLSRVTP